MTQDKKILKARYELVEEIAKGGFAIIYRGQDLHLKNRSVAIKQLRRDFVENENALKMFLAEIDLTIRLEHPNIVRIYDTIKEGDDYYIVLEFIDGINLKELINKTSDTNIHIPFNVSAYIISEICKALYYAHTLSDSATGIRLGIIHRDISPQNILLSYKGEVKLLDFGIAKARGLIGESDTTRLGLVKGKLSYMSPEQAQGKSVDRTSDLYSLGIVMYELFAMRKLFNADTDHQLLQKVAKGGIKRRKLDEIDAPEPLKRVLFKTLEVDRKKRFRNARDIKYDVDQYLRDFKHPGDELGQFISAIFKSRPVEDVESTATVDYDLSKPDKKDAKLAKREDERTIIDIIKVTVYSARKFALTIGLIAAAIIIALVALDTFQLQSTPVGKGLYNTFFPPIADIQTFPQGALVVLDGKPLKNKTPTQIPKISPGTHKLKLILDGYESIEKVIMIRGKEVEGGNRIEAHFEVPLSVTTQPSGAKVYIDGKLYPEPTPITHCRMKVFDEKKEIRLEYENFEPIIGNINLADGSGTIDKFFVFEEDEGSEIKYTITGKFSAECRFAISPKDAKVVINDKQYSLDDGSLTLLLLYGTNTLIVSKEGFVSYKEKITIDKGSVKRVNVSLRRPIIVYAKDKISGKTVKARVKIGNAKFTTGTLIPLTSGTREVTITAPYYVSKTVAVNVGKQKKYTIELDRAKPTLSVEVVYKDNEAPVMDAIIYLRIGSKKTLLGYTTSNGFVPETNEFEEGSYELMVTKDGETSTFPIKIEWGTKNFRIVRIPR